MMNQLADAFEKEGFKSRKKPQNDSPKKEPKDRPNLGWLFYRDYFRDIDFNNLKSNEEQIKSKIKNLLDQSPKLYNKTSLGDVSFELITTYPGLLLGSGYLHELPDVKGQAILGFDFDYTTGLPIIRGSSIKGVLKSAFRHHDYIKSLLHRDLDIENLEKEIFENSDIFFDAYITDFKDTLLSDDYITPHKEELKSPFPLRFIKVSPNVTFKFEFKFDKSTLITKEEKKELFKSIILDLGLGAKTNVGYGHFEEIDNISKS
jgi:CRISPR-associated protein Cmr6